MTAHDDAVKAAAEAICLDGWDKCHVRDFHLDYAETAVAAAAPILLAAERARIAALVADLRALHTPVGCEDEDRGIGPWCDECGDAYPCPTAALLDRHAPEEGS